MALKDKSYLIGDSQDHYVEEKIVFNEEDVKNSVKEFEEWILNKDPNLTKEEDNWVTFKIFKKIFGDFK